MTKTATRVTVPKPMNLPSRRAEGGSGLEYTGAVQGDPAEEGMVPGEAGEYYAEAYDEQGNPVGYGYETGEADGAVGGDGGGSAQYEAAEDGATNGGGGESGGGESGGGERYAAEHAEERAEEEAPPPSAEAERIEREAAWAAKERERCAPPADAPPMPHTMRQDAARPITSRITHPCHTRRSLAGWRGPTWHRR